MAIQNVNNRNQFSLKNAIVTSFIGASLASGIQQTLLPQEVKAAIKNAQLGEDKFIQRAVIAAEKTAANLKKTGTESIIKKNFSKINPAEVGARAAEMYPEILETAKPAMKNLTKTFYTVGGILLGAKLLFGLAAKHAQNKNVNQN